MNYPDLDAYIKEAEDIERMYMRLLEGTTQKRMRRADDGSSGLQNVEYKICIINSRNELLQSTLLQKYGAWYEACRSFALEYAGRGRSGKYESFTGLHERILSLIDLRDPVTNSSERKHLKNEFIACFDAQVSILRAIGPVIASAKNSHLRQAIADQVNSELEEAESLYQQGSVRSACTVAGLALERYLKAFCESNGIELGPEDTVVAMAQKILGSDKLQGRYPGNLRSIDHLAALWDKCTHPDEEPREHEVRELIDRIRELVFLAFC